MKFNKILLTLVLSMFVSTGVFASSQNIKIFIDDVELKTTTPPKAVNERVLVPLREIFEKMGATVNWDNSTKTITALKDNDEMILELGNVTAQLNGKEIILDTPALATNGVTLVPIRFVSETFGSYVYWNNRYQTVYIDRKGETNKSPGYEVTEFTNSRYFEFNQSLGEITNYSKDGPKDVIIPDIIAGNKVTSIGNKAFDHKELESIKIPGSILKIDSEAFSNNNLTKVNIPGNVTYIGGSAFASNEIQTINIAKGVKTLGNSSFYDNNLTTVAMPKTMRNIDNYAFGNNGLKTVSLNKGISRIGDGAFIGNNLKSADIPDSVTYIGAAAYKDNNIITISIPSYATLQFDAFDNWVNIIRR